ncbi:MAG: hypothetical protein ACTSXH_13750, partial [Promethearchaeota archaeon]
MACFQNLKKQLKNRKKYHGLLKYQLSDIVNFTFRLMKRHFSIEDLSGLKLEIAKDLQQEYGFHYTCSTMNAYSQALTALLGKMIYSSLIHPE